MSIETESCNLGNNRATRGFDSFSRGRGKDVTDEALELPLVDGAKSEEELELRVLCLLFKVPSQLRFEEGSGRARSSEARFSAGVELSKLVRYSICMTISSNGSGERPTSKPNCRFISRLRHQQCQLEGLSGRLVGRACREGLSGGLVGRACRAARNVLDSRPSVGFWRCFYPRSQR